MSGAGLIASLFFTLTCTISTVNAVGNLAGTQTVWFRANWYKPASSCSTCSPALLIFIKSNINATINGIVYGVVHNKFGQTILILNANVSAAPNYYSTTTIVSTSLPHGMYNVSAFVVTLDGIAVSTVALLNTTT
jgi:hypothetical protein